MYQPRSLIQRRQPWYGGVFLGGEARWVACRFDACLGFSSEHGYTAGPKVWARKGTNVPVTVPMT